MQHVACGAGARSNQRASSCGAPAERGPRHLVQRVLHARAEDAALGGPIEGRAERALHRRVRLVVAGRRPGVPARLRGVRRRVAPCLPSRRPRKGSAPAASPPSPAHASPLPCPVPSQLHGLMQCGALCSPLQAWAQCQNTHRQVAVTEVATMRSATSGSVVKRSCAKPE